MLVVKRTIAVGASCLGAKTCHCCHICIHTGTQGGAGLAQAV
jgi:hypothetical protein